MSRWLSGVHAIVSELRRRRVFRAGATYAVGAWVLIQVAATTFPLIGLPPSSARLVVILAIAGFPLALGLAWAFDLNPTRRAAADQEPAPGPLPGSPISRTIVLLALVALGGGVGYAGHVQVDRADAAQRRAIAVLPFENLSSDPDNEFFSDGVTEEIVGQLARVGTLRVISRAAVSGYRSNLTPLAEIARELDVGSVVEGSVQREGDRVRVVVRLSDARTGEYLWTQTYDRSLRDIFAIQSEIARNIAQKLRAELTPEVRERLEAPPTADLTAYDYYLQGKLARRKVTDPDVRRAITFLETAVRMDPGFAAAYGELALAYTYLYSLFDAGQSDLPDKALLAAERALELDPNQSDAYLARGRVLWTPASAFPHEAVIAEFRRALAANPNSEEAHFQLGQVYMHVGLFEEARKELRSASALNPVDTRARFALGQLLLYEMKPEEGLAAIRRTPRDYLTEVRIPHMAWALFLLGRGEEAEALMDQTFGDAPADRAGTIASMRAILAAARGDARAAESWVGQAALKERGSIRFHHTAYSLGVAYALLGQSAEAVVWLREAAGDGFPCYPLFITDPSLRSLRSHPEFERLLVEVRREWDHYRRQLGRS